MILRKRDRKTDRSKRVVSEASAWFVRLRGPDRDEAMLRTWRAWMAEHPDHERAFAEVSRGWQDAEALKGDPAVNEWIADATRKAERTFGIRIAVTAAASVIIVGVIAWHWMRPDSIVTGIGEQRSRILDDGSIVMLNTATRLDLEYKQNKRGVKLVKGEVSFDVAKDAARPFVVVMGNREVEALGTKFIARNESSFSAVTLLVGKVNVSSFGAGSASATKIALEPGERAVFVRGSSTPQIEHPKLADATAWKEGKANFDNTSLLEAVSELNRYNTLQLVIDDPDLEQLKISASPDVRTPAEFAESIARLKHLRLSKTDGAIHFAGRDETSRSPQ